MAFALERFPDLSLMNDDRFFKFAATRVSVIDGKYTKTYYPMHRCTDKDFEKFFPIDSRITKKVD